MRELPSPTTEIDCETPLYLSGAAAASTSPVTSPRVNWAPMLHRIGKVVLSKSGYGFRQEPTEAADEICSGGCTCTAVSGYGGRFLFSRTRSGSDLTAVLVDLDLIASDGSMTA